MLRYIVEADFVVKRGDDVYFGFAIVDTTDLSLVFWIRRDYDDAEFIVKTQTDWLNRLSPTAPNPVPTHG